MRLFQCHLRRRNTEADGWIETDGWIEERGARVGRSVELPKGSGYFWEVTSVGTWMEEEDLREAQRQRRKGLPSLRDTAKDARQRDEV